ncbi:MAG TPA: glycoside hydrolase family 3 N-terminal domain-containing protein [Jatrophihabitantaceae bacterium]
MVAAAAVVFGGSAAAVAATSDPSPTPLELQNAQLSRSAAAQGMVLLENHDHALPMPKRSTVALFGVGAYATVKGGTGSGNVNNRYTINVRSGLENAGYTVTTSSAYWGAMTSAYDTKYGGATSSPFGQTIDYASVEQPLTSSTVQPTAPTSTAIYVVARNSGEGADRSSGPGDYQLTSTEIGDIAEIGQTYRHVIVVLNVGGIIDTSFFAQVNGTTHDPSGGQAVDAMLLMSQAGEESGNALAEVLDGDVTPSGKLTDSWASKYSYYPASATFGNNDGNTTTEQYSEGIYVGYRYFDSFYKSINPSDPAGVVTYPFGYGLSYTDFRITPLHVSADLHTVTVQARVQNTGHQYSGKEVVEVYFSAPQTGVDKPYQQLAGYAKTDTLRPGASQVVTIRFRTTDMASYDTASSSYVMDAGNYVIRVGDSSRSTRVAAKINLSQRLTTELVNHEMNDAAPSSELHSNPANFYSYAGEQAQLAWAHTIKLNTRGFRPVDDRSRYEQDVPVDSSSPYYAIDGNLISNTTAYVPAGQTNWEGTGQPYQAKTGETVKQVRTDPNATLYDLAKGKLTLQQFVAGLDVDQLSTIVEGASAGGSVPQAVGAAGYTTSKYESLGIPGMTLSDGPAGLRLTQQVNSTPKTYQYETAWPIGTLLAQTWDRDLVQQVGDAIGKEMVEAGVTLWLAPGMNIHRDPLNGRNFEYFSEDPLIAGLTASAETLGVQSNPGVGVTIKHYVANNQEANRNAVNELIGERALREIYLRGFQIAVQSAQPMAVMSSYNQVNGTYSSANYDQLTDLLRGEWDFKGLVMTDWGGSHNPVATMYSGNDLIEPGGNPTEIAMNIKQVAPTLDVTGLPVLTTTVYAAFGFTSNQWSLGGLTLDANGDQTISTTVDASTDLSKVQSSTVTYDANFNPTTKLRGPYASVADAYADVEALLGGNALNAAQKAAITVTPTYQTAGDSSTPVVAYTITLKGHYPEPYTMRLGDLQRSAMRILTIVSKSAPFGQLAEDQHVRHIDVRPYSAQYYLRQFVTVTKGRCSWHLCG